MVSCPPRTRDLPFWGWQFTGEQISSSTSGNVWGQANRFGFFSSRWIMSAFVIQTISSAVGCRFGLCQTYLVVNQAEIERLWSGRNQRRSLHHEDWWVRKFWREQTGHTFWFRDATSWRSAPCLSERMWGFWLRNTETKQTRCCWGWTHTLNRQDHPE